MKPPDSTCWDWIHRAASDSFGTADRPVPRKPIVSLIQGLSIRQVRPFRHIQETAMSPTPGFYPNEKVRGQSVDI